MHDLKPLTALGNETARSETFGALSLTERPNVALASLSLRRDTPLPSLPGLTLPGPGDWAAGENYAAVWTGPGQWLIEAIGTQPWVLLQKLRASAPACSLTDQSDSWMSVDISATNGEALRRLMAKLVNLDADTLTSGRAARTVLHHLGVILIRRSDQLLTILGTRSTAQSLWHVLEETTRRQEGDR